MDKINLDTHTHLIPIVPRLLKKLNDVRWETSESALYVGNHKIAFPGLFEPDLLDGWLTKNNIEQAWISTPPPTYRQDLDVDACRSWVNYLNDALVEITNLRQGRYTAIPHIPVHHPELANEIAKQLIADGHRRFAMPSGSGQIGLSDKSYLPLWETLAAAKAFVFLHPPESIRDQRLASYYLFNLLGNPYEAALAVSHLVYGRVLERFPSIQFSVAHGGGATAIIAPRLGRGLVTRRPGIETGMTPPAEVLRRVMVDCIVHSPDAMALVERTFGAENVLFGSDWPFSMGLLNPHEQLADFPTESKGRIFRTNAKRLLT